MKAKRKLETVRTKIIVEREKLLCETSFLLFKISPKNCCRKSFEEFFKQFFVKTVERSTDEEETKMTPRAPPNQTNSIISKVMTWFKLGFCKIENKLKTCRKGKRLETVLKV